MPTDKRQRKKERSRARQEAMYAAHRRAAMRRRGVGVFVVVALLLAVVFLVSQVGDDDSEQVATDATTTSARETTTTAAGGPPEPCPPAGGAPNRVTSFPAPPPECIDPAKSYEATIETDVGTFTAKLDAARAPRTVNNFVYLARYRYYEGVTFHRVIPGFVVQGGDPEGTGSGGPGYTFGDELPKQGEYKVGSLAMANSGPDTNGSQFFIVTGDQGVSLPPNYSLFGEVTGGLDVVKKIEADGSPAGDPKTVHKMAKVTIKES